MSAPLAGARVLVAGASGFYGRNLLAGLAGSGAEVLATSRGPAPPGTPARTWRQADLADPAQTAALFAAFRPQIVFHLTSASLGGLERANVRASVAADLLPTLNVLEAAAEAGVARVILPCSMEEPFPVADVAGELAVPETPYAMSKLVTGLYGRFFAERYGVPVAVLRCFLTYGPYQKAQKLIPYVIGCLARGEAPRLSAGTRRIDWIYVEDVIGAFLAAATAAEPPRTVLEIGTGALLTIRDVVGRIHRHMGGPAPVFGAVAARGGERPARVADAARVLGWQPRIDLDDGLRRTIRFYTP